MSDDEKCWFGVLAAIVLLTVGAFSHAITYRAIQERYRREAVERGFAEWQPDPADGTPEWRWKDSK